MEKITIRNLDPLSDEAGRVMEWRDRFSKKLPPRQRAVLDDIAEQVTFPSRGPLSQKAMEQLITILAAAGIPVKPILIEALICENTPLNLRIVGRPSEGE
jgi:hypothetical protein